jgi:hypothetical protein
MSTFLAAFKVFENEKGWAYDRALEAAQKVTNDAHFIYGKPNLTAWMNRKGGKLLKAPYIFRAFEHNYVQMLQHLGATQGRQGKWAAVRSLATLAALGGGPALPFFTLLAAGLRGLGADDPEEKVRIWLNEADPSEISATIWSDGLPGILGASVRGSLQVGAYDTAPEITFGITGSLYRDIVDSAKYASNRDFDLMLQRILPTAMSNAFSKAPRGYLHGVHTRFGTPLREGLIGETIKYTPYEALLKGLSFAPTREARAYRLKELSQREKLRWDDRRRSIYGKIARGVRMNNNGLLEAAIQDISNYERDRAQLRAIDVTGITRQGLQASLQEEGLSKREVLRVLRLTGRLPDK